MARYAEIPARPSVADTLRSRGASLLPSTTEERADRLDGTPWMHRLNWRTVSGIAAFLRLYELAEGRWLFKEGDTDDFLAIIVDGTLEIRKTDHDEREHVVARLGRGKIVGEMSLIDGATRSASAVATTRTQLLVLSRDDLDAMAQREPLFAYKIALSTAETLAHHLRQTTGTLVEHLPALGEAS